MLSMTSVGITSHEWLIMLHSSSQNKGFYIDLSSVIKVDRGLSGYGKHTFKARMLEFLRKCDFLFQSISSSKTQIAGDLFMVHLWVIISQQCTDIPR